MNNFTDSHWFPGKAGGLFGFLHMTKNSPLTWWRFRAQTNSVDKPLARGLHTCMRACSVAESCLTLCDPMDRSPPGSSVHGTSQVRILEWVAFPPPEFSIEAVLIYILISSAGGLSFLHILSSISCRLFDFFRWPFWSVWSDTSL